VWQKTQSEKEEADIRGSRKNNKVVAENRQIRERTNSETDQIRIISGKSSPFLFFLSMISKKYINNFLTTWLSLLRQNLMTCINNLSLLAISPEGEEERD
jgi:hypothetical protein